MLATTLLLKEGRYNIEQEFSDADNRARFQAFDTVNETAVTIAEVPLRLPKVATAAQREALNQSFETQALTLEKFSHRSALSIHDHFTEGGRHYVVTDLVDGLDLESSLQTQKRAFSVAEVVGWADVILEALNALHTFRPPTFFKAIRPENLVVKGDKSIGLLMSAAVVCGEPTSVSSSDDSVAYSPLEQLWSGLDAASQKVIINKYDEASERVLKQDLDARSDIYSLGATLYYLLTARRPVDVLERSIEMIEGNPDPLKSPHKVDPAIPIEVSDVIMKAMEIKREYRFDSAAIMRQVLKTALVRVKEREAEEASEQEEAAADILKATMERQSPNGSETQTEAVMAEASEAVEKAVEAEPQVGAAEPVVAEVPEVEEKTPAAEPRAIESEKKLPQAEPARVTEAFNLAELDDDLLGLLSPTTHTSEPPQQVAASPAHTSTLPISVDEPVVPANEPTSLVEEEVAPPSLHEDVVAAEVPVPVSAEMVEVEEELEAGEFVAIAEVVEEVTTAEGEFATEQEEVTVMEVEEAVESVEVENASYAFDSEPSAIEEVETSPVVESVEVEKPVEIESKSSPAQLAFASAKQVETYDEVAAPRGGLPIPALAAVAAVLVAVVVGGIYFMGSSSSATVEPPVESKTAAPAAQTEEPSSTSNQVAPQAQPETQVAQPENPAVVSTETSQDPQKTAVVNPQKQKKPTPAPTKAPAQKKAVTVDDLINDN